jgi:hypothetical protein
MGRSMSAVTPDFLEKIPQSASIFDAHLNRHFEVSVRDGNLYQGEFEMGPNGEPIFRESRKIDWVIGAAQTAWAGWCARQFPVRSAAFLLFEDAQLGALARLPIRRLRLRSPHTSCLYLLPQRDAAANSRRQWTIPRTSISGAGYRM